MCFIRSADLETRCGADVPPESELGKRCSVWSYLASADLEERAHVSSYIPSSGKHLITLTFPRKTDRSRVQTTHCKRVSRCVSSPDSSTKKGAL